MLLLPFCSTRRGGFYPHNDSASTSSPCSGSASSWPPLTRRGPPAILSICFSVFSWPSGVFFFFWVGGVPLAVFSPPPVSWFWVVGLGISACSCVLHLSLATRATWSSDPQPPRPPQPLVLARPASPISCWELSVGRAETKGCGVTGGFVTPHTV